MRTDPSWLLDLAPDDLSRVFGEDVLAQGRELAASGGVEGVAVPSSTMVTGRVTDADGDVWHATALTDRHGLRGVCSCKARKACAHVAAVVAHVQHQASATAATNWQEALRPLLKRPEPAPTGTKLALEFNERPDGITVRPLRAGQHGRWLRNGISWSQLRSGWQSMGLNRPQAEALRAVQDAQPESGHYGYASGTLMLDGLRPAVWAALARAKDAGVQFLNEDAALASPRLADPAEPALTIRRTADGVEIAPVLAFDGERHALASVRLIGRPSHGVAYRDAAGALVLAPLSRPLSDAEYPFFLARRALAIPAAELGVLASGYLPNLRQHFAVDLDPSIELPEAQDAQLVCRVRFAEASAGVSWAFRYGALDLPATPRHDDPSIRNVAAESRLTATVLDGPWKDADADGVPHLCDVALTGRPLFRFVGQVLPDLRERGDVIVELNAEPPTYTEAPEAPQVSVRLTDTDDSDWFGLRITVQVGDAEVPLRDVLAALTAGDDHVLLPNGTWFALDIPQLDALRTLVAEAAALSDAGPDDLKLRVENVGLWEELVSLGVVAEQSASWTQATDALLNLDALPEVPTPTGLQASLRHYQESGLAWMTFLRRSRLGGILADDMGLGKTVQTLAMLLAAVEEGVDAPALVVAPTSVVGTWVAEAARFAPSLKVAAITQTDRRRGTALDAEIDGAQVVITSYALLRLDAEAYRHRAWSTVVLDEAQFVKNYKSQAYKVIRRLKARSKLALTGTPLENNLMDLWSLLSITAPGLFPSPRDFAERYRKPIEGGDLEMLARLHRRTRPLMLRRTKDAVASELPEKQEQIVPVELSDAHRAAYDRQLTHERQKVLGLVDDLGRNRMTILRSLTLLRQLALDPHLVDAAAASDSAKIDTLVDMLHELIEGGHRALVFSQFTSYLALVTARLDTEGIGFEYLDGRTHDRAERVEAFKTGDAPVFVISLKAGGFGLTLTEADYVFILDPWWNPAAETQAIDRAHRIGQDKPVNVYRLVSTDTIEEKVVALQARKRDLFNSVVGKDAGAPAPLTADDIRGLLDE